MFELKKTVNIDKIDIIFIFFIIGLSIYYRYYISLIPTPGWDASVYLANARSWLYNDQLLEIYRPPLISWLIAGIWSFTGENWMIVKPLQAIFTIGAGILLYIIIRTHKGSLFALCVVVLTMLNTQVFFFSVDIITEGISLFFLIATIYFLKSEKESHWYLAGITLGLTFASRYPIIVQAVAIFIVEYIIRRDRKFLMRVITGCLIIPLMVLVIFLKTGTFQTALPKDIDLVFLSPFYLLNSIDIWGPIFLFVPLALISKKTYTDKYNLTFIVWFITAIIFWSLSASNYQYRFTMQYTPAVYYLSILAIENIYKSDNILFEIQEFVKDLSEKIRLLSDRVLL